MIYTDFHKLSKNDVGTTLTVGGFVHTVRDHGGLIFFDLRQGYDLLQCVIDPEKQPEFFKIAEEVHTEYVLKITGEIIARSSETINPNLPTGEIEVEISELEIVSKAKTPPFDVHADQDNLSGEDIRLKYRYLDLRREHLQKLLKKKHDLLLQVRNWFSDQEFTEIQTPILANSTPEGARDFLVPSRLHPGKFYALPQAPQQFKQLLMVGGIKKYIQMAPCFRDEDPRADRHPGDFYQIDGEVAWAQEEDIYELSKKLIEEVFIPFSGKKQVLAETLPKIGYFESMDTYGTDKPDIRYELKWEGVKELFKDSGFEVFAKLAEKSGARVQALHIKGAVNEFSRSDLDRVQALGRDHGLPGIAYIQYFEDGAKSPIFKFLGEEKSAEVQEHFGAETGDLILFVANEDKQIVWKAINAIRQHIGAKLGLIKDEEIQFVWIDRFPLFETDEDTGEMVFTHNPFSAWEGGLEGLKKAEQDGTLTELYALQYDIGVNGYEVLSGGVRNTDPEAQLRALELAGYTEGEVREKFGHMLEAYTYGSPVHAGFAWGFDRLFMVLTDEENIREVIAFPKNGRAVDPMTGAPSEVNPKQLQELGIKLES
jgi:aspartyl-tRNA synthetase